MSGWTEPALFEVTDPGRSSAQDEIDAMIAAHVARITADTARRAAELLGLIAEPEQQSLPHGEQPRVA